jgi:DNA-binding CsgD family transcriptional regulator
LGYSDSHLFFVLGLLANGATIVEIAGRLKVSTRSTHARLRAVRIRMKARRNEQAIYLAMAAGFIDGPDLGLDPEPDWQPEDNWQGWGECIEEEDTSI